MAGKSFFLTFDGAPNPPGTDAILNVLAKHEATATFFMEGRRLETEEGCARRVLQAGHNIGNHSYNHPDFDAISVEECMKEVERTEQILYEKLGVRTTLLRPPSGKLTKDVEETFLNLGYSIVLWSYSVKDWAGPDAYAVANRVLTQARDNAVVVFHDHVSLVPATLEIIIPKLKEYGYLFKRISEWGMKGLIK